MKRPLRSGYTTGACAAAAAKGAALLLRDGQPAGTVTIALPSGEEARFTLHRQEREADSATCSVIKDAGDDPDITNGAEIVATVASLTGESSVVIVGGSGVGRVTKPGLAVAVGEWAINPVPRQMITAAVRSVFPEPASVQVAIAITNGAELAQKTLNNRLGIVGGLSILGTTGIVRPISARAWTDTIDAAIDVALACGSTTVVLSTGRTSEVVAQTPLQLPEEAFVMMGDHIGYALASCSRKGVAEVVLACQFAKLVKIACGHEQTHVSSSELDLQMLASWVRSEPRISGLESRARQANTARQLLEDSDNDSALIELVAVRARAFARKLAPESEVKVLLAGYDGKVLYFA
ncbi:putative cobalt-precorrin-6A synthase [Geobacter sp. OR-1]|uniref:cobalt-precorrin-5B (C(1))-methyltransferase n=1 Tax=Geobacter sp. OR-1 TaxID=1266765 RepID=UPI00054214D1|nr:cobalt-precorrin-5B (C(1))-methyltransferase [Geobacter sp. OR-1]GAM09627.1 putative cobalt-precorrin-6A synthase [Geobacter sp. OR-1]